MSWSLHCNLNVNVLIVFLLFVMHWQVSGREKISHCNIKISTYSYIFSEWAEKRWEGRRQRDMAVHFEFPMEYKQPWSYFCIKQGNIQGELCGWKRNERRREYAAELKRVEENKQAARRMWIRRSWAKKKKGLSRDDAGLI